MSDDATDPVSDRPAGTGRVRDGNPVVEIDDVSVSYGDESILEGVSETIRSGELVGLVGPNGAGKTTLLRTVYGTLAPDDGTVRLRGDDVQSLSQRESSRRVAVVPQNTELSFEFTVRQLVEMGRHPHRSRFERPTDRDRALVERAMERTRTRQFAERSIQDVSGGERQRVLLARALAQNAPVMALDEPTASLDLNHAVETMALVRRLVDDGRSAVAAIHDLELAARFCDRLLLLSDGELLAAGQPTDVLQSDLVSAGFDARAAVEPEPVGGGVSVHALPTPSATAEVRTDARVHVVGGGETAAAALGELGTAGARTSIGPVASGDRACNTARAFDAEVVEVPPLSEASPAAVDRCLSLVRESDATVLAASGRTALPEAWRRVAGTADRLVVLAPDGSDEMESTAWTPEAGASEPAWAPAGERDSGTDTVLTATRDDLLAAVESAVGRDADFGTLDDRQRTSTGDATSAEDAETAEQEGGELEGEEQPPWPDGGSDRDETEGDGR